MQNNSYVIVVYPEHVGMTAEEIAACKDNCEAVGIIGQLNHDGKNPSQSFALQSVNHDLCNHLIQYARLEMERRIMMDNKAEQPDAELELTDQSCCAPYNCKCSWDDEDRTPVNPPTHVQGSDKPYDNSEEEGELTVEAVLGPNRR